MMPHFMQTEPKRGESRKVGLYGKTAYIRPTLLANGSIACRNTSLTLVGLLTQILFDQIPFTDLSKACKHAAGPYKRF